MDYQLMQSLEQLERLCHKFPNFTMVNDDSLKEHIKQIDENYPLSMTTCL